MSIWTLLQVIFDLSVFAAFSATWLRLRRPPQDDPRMSRGLQLLQTKITVLEDLSDRTDAQVKQLSSLLDHKARIVQNKILEAEQQILKIDHSMNKSLEVAEIFQDKIPHQEILERQRTVEYVKAARMAHSGLSVDEIAKTIHLPREQIELIAKFNREQLMFDEAQLPEWAQELHLQESHHQEPPFALNKMDFVAGLETQAPPDLRGAEKIGQDFKQAVADAKQNALTSSIMDTKMGETIRSGYESVQPAMMGIKATAQTFKDKLVTTAEDLLRAQAQNRTSSAATTAEKAQVRKVIFPRIEKS